MDNGEVSGLLAHIFTVYQGSSGPEAAIVNLRCCISECIDSFKCFVPENDAHFFVCYDFNGVVRQTLYLKECF